MASQSRQALRPLLHQLAPPRQAAAAAAGRLRRPLSTSSSGTTTAAASPPPTATTAGVGGGAAAPEAAAAEEAGSWSRKVCSWVRWSDALVWVFAVCVCVCIAVCSVESWVLTPPPRRHRRPPHPQLKIAAFVLGPLSLPAGLVAAIVYDEEFRDDVDRRFPELGGWLLPAIYLVGRYLCRSLIGPAPIDPYIYTRAFYLVDAVRQRVGFEEDLRRRLADLEKAFISSQRAWPVGRSWSGQGGVFRSHMPSVLTPTPIRQPPPRTAVGVTVQLQSGARYAEERVSPLKTLAELYDTLVGGQATGAGPVVAMEFADIAGYDASSSSSSSPLAASGGAWAEWGGVGSVRQDRHVDAKPHAPHISFMSCHPKKQKCPRRRTRLPRRRTPTTNWPWCPSRCVAWSGRACGR